MIKFLKSTGYFLLITIAILSPVFAWQKFWIFSNFSLAETIILTCLGCTIILTEILSNCRKTDDEKLIETLKKEPIKILFPILYDLDNEKDIRVLRRIRKRVNQKIAQSTTNKKMVQATKDLCGKNCKCKEIKKFGGCETCKLYDSYVEYLLKVTEE